jgi:hypothetical protein
MRYLRTSGLSMLEALRPAAAVLDACWWHIGGHGFSMTKEFVKRFDARRLTQAELYEHYMQLLTDYVDHDTPVGRVGKPGFFSSLGDSVDFSWACHFAVEGDQMPLASLRVVSELKGIWFSPLENLPLDVALVARDVDAAYQEYGFRDEWMFAATHDHLRRGGYAVEEVTEWPHA